MSRLFLHIGSPKTGSTAIQHFLAENREALLRHRILYPRAATIGQAHHVIGAAVHPWKAHRLGGMSPDAALAQATAEIAAEIEAHRPETLVLSTEYLWGALAPAHVRRVLEAFPGWNLRVITYLRRQDLLAQALYVQSVKAGHTGGFAEWLKGAQAGPMSPFEFDRILQSWAGCGAEVVVRVYEKGSIAADIRADFLEILGAAGAVPLPAENDSVNATPDAATVEIMRIVSREIGDAELANRIRRRIMKYSPPRSRFSPLSYFRGDEASRFLAKFAEGNMRVARDFLGRADGVLFRDAIPPPGEDATAETNDAALLRRLVRLLPQLVVDRRKQDKRQAAKGSFQSAPPQRPGTAATAETGSAS
jgi:hypothetical protein